MRPRITLSYAQSLDGSIGLRASHPRLILSGVESMNMTHALRAQHDAILVGIGTVLGDNPRLSVRLVPGRNPQPVLLDSHLRCPLDVHLVRNPVWPLWIFATVHAPQTHQQKLEDAGARIWRVAADAQGHVDLDAVLALLHAAGVRTLMVEGGARVISAFFAAQLADRVVVTIAPKLVAGLHAVQSDMVQNAQLVNVHYQQLGDDMVLEADVVWR